MKAENTMHDNLIKNYIAVLNEVVFTINGSLKIVTEAPSINIGKYYMTEANMLRVNNIGKPGDSLLYLSKIYEIKKHLNFMNKLGSNLLKDIIDYSNKYGLNEINYFEKINPITNIAKENYQKIIESINNQSINFEEKELKNIIAECDGVLETYYKVLTQIRRNLDSEEYNHGIFFKNNLYKNIKKINIHMNVKIISDINSLIRKNKLLRA